MAAFYFDTSAVVKRYVSEPGSTWVREICDLRDRGTGTQANLVMIGSITVVEVAAALSILERRNVIRGPLSERAYQKFFVDHRDEYQVVEISSDTFLNAAELARRYPLKAYDAVQLALALEAQAAFRRDSVGLTFVSGDRQLLQAAAGEGLAVQDPFAYSHLDNPPSQ